MFGYFRRAMLAVLIVAAVILGSAACGSSSKTDDPIKSAGVLRVGTEGVYSPFSFHDPASGQLVGYDVDVAKAVGQKLGVKVEFVETPWDSMFAALEADRFDIVANQVTINPERQAKYDLSQPYTVGEGVIVTRANDDSIKSLADIKGTHDLNADRDPEERGRLVFLNRGDRPIQIGSHIHLPDVNPALKFDRKAADGFRLDIPSGTSERFEPGASRELDVVALRGRRRVPGIRVRPLFDKGSCSW